MRDKLIHGYFGVDLDVVWKTVTEDIPVLYHQMEEILGSEGDLNANCSND